MKALFIKCLRAILALVVFSSCSETFRTLDVTILNKRISERTDIETPEELIKVYYTAANKEVQLDRVITTAVRLDGNRYQVTLIDEHLEDDAQAAEKLVMTASWNGRSWRVTDIKQSWKCVEGRGGHTDWGNMPCP